MSDNLPADPIATEIATLREQMRNDPHGAERLQGRHLELIQRQIDARPRSAAADADLSPIERTVVADLHPEDVRELQRAAASLPQEERDIIRLALRKAQGDPEYFMGLVAYQMDRAGLDLDRIDDWLEELPSRLQSAVKRGLGL